MIPTEKALKTWYNPDHPLHLDPLPAALGLAGEAGELIDLYKKHRFKEGFSWWDCAECEHPKENHINGMCEYLGCVCNHYTPKILDELGDKWFYLRISAYQKDYTFEGEAIEERWHDFSYQQILANLNHSASSFLLSVLAGYTPTQKLQKVYFWFAVILERLDINIDQLTESNWNKLKGGDNNGWKITVSQSNSSQH